MPERILKRLKEFIVTGFFTGYIPIMPGTFGTVLGAVIYVLFSSYDVFYYIFLALFFLLSIPLATYAEKHIFQKKDSPHIVIDEVLGYMVTMITFPFDGSIDSIRYAVIGFVLFRVFDIWKPYPIKHSQELEGGLGITVDDVIAGIYANLFLQFLRLTNGSLFTM